MTKKIYGFTRKMKLGHLWINLYQVLAEDKK